MPSWFSKVFKEPEKLDPAPASAAGKSVYADDEEEYDEPGYEPRRIVQAPVVVDAQETSGWSPEIRIKAQYQPADNACTLLVDRPVLDGHSFWCPNRETAYAHSPLASSLFDLGGLKSVLIHDMTVTVTREEDERGPWEETARAIGAEIRVHLKSGLPVLNPDFLDRIPPEDEIRGRLQGIIDREINPGIASHSGVITLNRVKGNTAYITMGGGCQGCAASAITLRSGVEQSFREAVPELGALLDETDHASGVNPYFSALPAGMG